MQYYNEVHPAKIVFVSFLEKDQQKGRMVQSLENLGIIPLQLRLDQSRPDLSKLDALIGTLSAETDFFSEGPLCLRCHEGILCVGLVAAAACVRACLGLRVGVTMLLVVIGN